MPEVLKPLTKVGARQITITNAGPVIAALKTAIITPGYYAEGDQVYSTAVNAAQIRIDNVLTFQYHSPGTLEKIATVFQLLSEICEDIYIKTGLSPDPAG